MATTGEKKKILLVEDDAFLGGMYVTKLNLEGFDVQLAGDGEKGLRLAQTMQPALILLDIVLPKMGGFDVLKSLRADQQTRNIPVILLSNLGQREDVQRGLELGAQDYLIKAHFMPSEVVGKIAALIGKK
ncbi:MAG: response regulator [Patescibacteria group bacterium]